MEILTWDINRTPGGGTRVASGALLSRALFAGRLFAMAIVITAPRTRSLVRRSLKDRKNNEGQTKQVH